jgi:hypothetical protein
MRTLGLIEPQMLLLAAFSRHSAALAWARQRLTESFGPIGIEGPTIPFESTKYYTSSMGHDLSKQYLAFNVLQGPDQLAAVKRRTLDLELELAACRDYAEARPLNLDPGFLGLGKFVLATTKDQAHRLYLHGGIFAEVTLRYHDGHFEPQPWTYPDWHHPDVIAFLHEARTRFSHLRTSSARPTSDLPPLLIPGRDLTDH